MDLARRFVAFLIASMAILSHLAAVAGEGQPPKSEGTRTGRTVRVFILAGQSNAVGYNKVKEYKQGQSEFPEAFRNQPDILFWDAKKGFWSSLRIGESEGDDPEAFGPEIGFAHDLAGMLPNDQIAIVKCAAGGTGIARSSDYHDYIPSLKDFDDKGNNWHPPSDGRDAGKLYQGLITKVRAAVSALERDGRKYELSGFLWMQGEHEAGISPTMARDYGDLLTSFIRAVRTDLKTPSLPVAVGEINSFTWAFADIAQKAQAKACREDRNVVLVKTIDLPRNGSGGLAHFTADGTIELGSRFALAMNQLLAQKATAPRAVESSPSVTLESLLREMVDPDSVARLPKPQYTQLQASSYNRESKARGQPGWFADGDGGWFSRTETINGRQEWVIMEHEGPGCITKIWTPFFYCGFNDLKGPNVRIYLDGATLPVLDESLIELVTGEGSFKPPFGVLTARAGDSYMPIPFARSCKVTMAQKPFYYIINYRAYAGGTSVKSFRMEQLRELSKELEKAGKILCDAAKSPEQPQTKQTLQLAPGGTQRIDLPAGPAAVRWFSIRLKPGSDGLAYLRSTVMKVSCDGELTVWCPVGDFFCCADSIHPYHTWQRTVEKDGTMTCRWPMPYRKSATLSLENLGKQAVTAEVCVGTAPWTWDERSMYFHASWRPDDFVQGTPSAQRNTYSSSDWNFIDIRGQGVFAGDAWTVLNPEQGWWGEGDEKIYVDEAWDKGFPTHFGTGSEDYYGWAGGVQPTRADEFDKPFLANVRIGGVDGINTRGFNILTRTRALDAIPFNTRLCFDMEASPGGLGEGFLGYSVATFWYARPGATHNRPPLPEAAARPIMSLADIEAREHGGKAPAEKGTAIGGGCIEFDLLKPTAVSQGLEPAPQRPHESFNPKQWSGEQHLFIPASKAGDFVEFTFEQQFTEKSLTLYMTTSYDFGVASISVNGKVVAEKVDLFSDKPSVRAVALGNHVPVDNRFVLRCELVEPNPRSRGAKTYMGLDSIRIDQEQ